MPSLRLHLRHAEGPTEVRWLNGAVAEAAARTGIAAPVNGRLAALVDEAAADPERRAWFRGRPGRLLEAIGDLPAER
jgi:2-dehydropantoate 2-reductase